MKRRIIALLAVLLLLLCGCDQKSDGLKPMEQLFEKTPVSMEEGHFFFAGKIKAASAAKQNISFYEAEAEKNTFYQVEITDDPFGCMPERVVTVCILGAVETFNERTLLQKDKEYLFDTSLWVQGEEAVFLLPTFYESLPERAGDELYYTNAEGRSAVDGSYADYSDRLKELAKENAYGPEKILTAAKERLKSAKERDMAYFKDLKFENLDEELLTKTNRTAAALLQKAEQAENDWESIRGFLQ